LVNLNEIRTFVTVARTGSIQAVAHDAVCGVTAVQRLEQDLGATLFDRQTKPAGSRSSMGSASSMRQRHFRKLSPAAAPSGVLRIGTAHVLAEAVAERLPDPLRSRFPDLTLQIAIDWARPLLERLRNGDLDAAVISLLGNGEPKTELPSRRLGKEGRAKHRRCQSCSSAPAFVRCGR
jgi:DNA-binding transcriptional LysR family regulator